RPDPDLHRRSPVPPPVIPTALHARRPSPVPRHHPLRGYPPVQRAPGRRGSPGSTALYPEAGGTYHLAGMRSMEHVGCWLPPVVGRGSGGAICLIIELPSPVAG